MPELQLPEVLLDELELEDELELDELLEEALPVDEVELDADELLLEESPPPHPARPSPALVASAHSHAAWVQADFARVDLLSAFIMLPSL